jgi:hypothetical protein
MDCFLSLEVTGASSSLTEFTNYAASVHSGTSANLLISQYVRWSDLDQPKADRAIGMPVKG